MMSGAIQRAMKAPLANACGAFFVGGFPGKGPPLLFHPPTLNYFSQPSGLPSGRLPKVESPEPRIPPVRGSFYARRIRDEAKKAVLILLLLPLLLRFLILMLLLLFLPPG